VAEDGLGERPSASDLAVVCGQEAVLPKQTRNARSVVDRVNRVGEEPRH
jgi:hypothetical protein